MTTNAPGPTPLFFAEHVMAGIVNRALAVATFVELKS